MKKLLFALALLFSPPAFAQTAQPTAIVVDTCASAAFGPAGRSAPLTVDPTGQNCISGTINATNPSVDATGGAVPADATYVAGNKSGVLTGLTLDSSNNLNVNVAGGSISATSAADATVAAPSYSEGVSEPLSQNLTGDLRVIAKQNGAWSVTANAGTNLNTSALALESGGNLAAIATSVAGTLTVDNAGTFAVQCTSGCAGSGGTSSAFSATFPADGTAAGASDGTNMQPLLVDGSGNLKVAQQGNVTVVGTGTLAVQAAQSGAWDITNISGTVSLPTGAATAAKQPALGTAGTASSDVITVQGIASMTPLLVDGTGGSFPISGTVTANAGTNLNTSLLALESGGNLAAIASSVAGTLATEGTGTAGTPAGGILTIQGATSMTPVVVSDGSGAMNVIVDSGTLTAVTSITNPVTVTDGAGALNVIVDSSALPSGAATESTLGGVLTSTNFAAAFGTAGTADSQVMSVQGIASMTPLLANPGTAANWGVGATASAVPANGVYLTAGTDGGLSAGTAAAAGLIQCQSSVAIDTASSGNVELVSLTSSERIYVCGYNFIASGTVDVQLIYGTGTACATGETNLTGAYSLTAQAGIVVNSPFWNGMAGATSNALCIELGGAVQVSGSLMYTKF